MGRETTLIQLPLIWVVIKALKAFCDYMGQN